MSNKLFDAFEACLQALEKGETLDAALARFPSLSSDLRPMLEASLHAQTLARPSFPDAAQRRVRSRLLQTASEMREAKRTRRRTWLYNFRPLAVTVLLALFFLSSTGLVNASSGSLPGDNLYPVKRTWEDFRLIFVFSEEAREGLEMEYEGERVVEIHELLAKGRAEPVTFSGYVSAQTDTQWTVSGIITMLASDTILPTQPITIGAAVTVTGMTTADGVMHANMISSVPYGISVPTPKPENDDDSNGRSGSGDNSGNETEPTPSSGDDSEESGKTLPDARAKLQGVIQSISGNIWIIDGQLVNVSSAKISGTPKPGDTASVEGYMDANGEFVAIRVVIGDRSNNDNGSGGNNDGGDDHDGEDD
jgi:hypothetical protein